MPKPKSKPKAKPASKQIINYLKKSGINFDVIPHRKVYTAYDLAQTAGAKLDEIAKTLLLRVELPMLKKKGAYFVVVLPASYNVDLQKVKRVLKATKVEFAPEKVFKKLGLEPGAVSPFGSLRKFGVLVDSGLLKTKQALVGAESFTESLRLKAKDLIDLEQALVAIVGRKNKLKVRKESSVKKSVKTKVKAKLLKSKSLKKVVKKPVKKIVKKSIKKVVKKPTKKKIVGSKSVRRK